MYNAFTVYSGIELYPKADLNFLAHYNVLIKKPTYGITLNYERRLGKYIALGIGSSWYYGQVKEDISTGEGPESDQTVTLINRYRRIAFQLSTRIWAIEKKRYSLTPGFIFMYGRTLPFVYDIQSINYTEQLNFDHRYGNVSFSLTQQFLLKRLSSVQKGHYGKLILLASPFIIANIYTNLDWQTTVWPETQVDKTVGYGINIGLQLAF
jgi:hypothetical protein